MCFCFLVLSPPIGRLVDVSSDKVEIHWKNENKNDNACKPIMLYITCTPDVDEVVHCVKNTVKNSSSIHDSDIILITTNLDPYTNYSCTANVLNEIGMSEKSDEVTFETKSKSMRN